MSASRHMRRLWNDPITAFHEFKGKALQRENERRAGLTPADTARLRREAQRPSRELRITLPAWHKAMTQGLAPGDQAILAAHVERYLLTDYEGRFAARLRRMCDQEARLRGELLPFDIDDDDPALQ